jgi:hypothetical protein
VTVPDKLPAALIDMHCHVFNGTDLPAVTFIDKVVRQRYGMEGDAISLIVVGAVKEFALGHAPRAGDELADIRHKPRPPLDDEFDGQDGAPANAAAAPGADGAGALAGDDGLIAWIAKFGLSRRDLIAKLASHYQSTGQRCVLMTPALVDFDGWLAYPEKRHQRITDQVAVMGEISRQPGPVRVHGFVGFDPVRAILARQGYNPSTIVTLPPIDPHKLVQSAIMNQGFLGVKLYPPMGFRAWNNGADDMTFSHTVKQWVNVAYPGIGDHQLGTLIDEELAQLYKFCAAEGVPILAHGYNSNQSDNCYGWRASPQYWREVIKKFSTAEKPLRLCLAHFGRFDAHTVNAGCVSPGIASQVWETIFASILNEPGSTHVYADFSYFSEVLDRREGWEQRRAKLADKLKNYFAHNDKQVEHVCFGSDWILLGLEAGHQRFHEEIGLFLRDEVHLTKEQLGRVFFGNALRYLGLLPGDQNYVRLKKFYQDNHIEEHFPQLDALV